MALITCDQTSWLLARLEKTEASILAYEDAIDNLSTAQSYTLDTGQSRQVVTRANLTELHRTMRYLEAKRERLRRQLGCGGPSHVRPGW